MSDKKYGKKLKKALEFIKDTEEPLNVKRIGKEVDLNLMFLSGALTAFSQVGALQKNILGRQHIYGIGDEDFLDKTLERIKN